MTCEGCTCEILEIEWRKYDMRLQSTLIFWRSDEHGKGWSACFRNLHTTLSRKVSSDDESGGSTAKFAVH